MLIELHFRLKDTYSLNIKGWKRIFHENGNKKLGGNTCTDTVSFNKIITRNKGGSPSNSTSEYLFKATQNRESKTHMHPNVYCRIIYNSQDMERT